MSLYQRLKERVTLFLLNLSYTKEDNVQYSLGLQSRWKWRDCPVCRGSGKIRTYDVPLYKKCNACRGSGRQLIPLRKGE